MRDKYVSRFCLDLGEFTGLFAVLIEDLIRVRWIKTLRMLIQDFAYSFDSILTQGGTTPFREHVRKAEYDGQGVPRRVEKMSIPVRQLHLAEIVTHQSLSVCHPDSVL